MRGKNREKEELFQDDTSHISDRLLKVYEHTIEQAFNLETGTLIYAKSVSING